MPSFNRCYGFVKNKKEAITDYLSIIGPVWRFLYRKYPVYSGHFYIFIPGDFLNVTSNVKAETTAETSAKAFASADTDDKVAGNPHHAAGTAY